MAQKSLTYKEKSGITFVAQDDPPFIKELKKRVGYKEGPKLGDKFDQQGPSDADDPQTELLRLKEEDRPQVVVLDPKTDLCSEDVTKELAARQKEIDAKLDILSTTFFFVNLYCMFGGPLRRTRKEDRKIAEGKIVFRKPSKRSSEANEKVPAAKKKIEVVKQPESRLLSFGNGDQHDE